MLLQNKFPRGTQASSRIRSLPDKVVSVVQNSVSVYENNDIIPEFVQMYSNFCQAVPVEQCRSMMVIPDAPEQMHILNMIKTLSQITNIDSLKGVLIYLLSIKDIETFEKIINNVITYNNSLETIRDTIKGLVN